MLDEGGSLGSALQLAQRVSATEGRFPSAALEDGHDLLVEVELVVSRNGRFQATPALAALAKLDDESALELLRRHCDRARRERSRPRSIEEERVLVGSVGEELVVDSVRLDLQRIGRDDLVDQVQRVSLIDDGLGYDVQAPALDGRLRYMEVKSSVAAGTTSFQFFLTRNEFDVGLRNASDWTLVACQVGDDRTREGAAVLGWTSAAVLRPYLPEDANGRWTEAFVRLPRSVLTPGLPPGV